jgi:hypothetical protein
VTDKTLKNLVDVSDNVFTVAEIQEAKVLASVLSKLYGKPYKLGDIIREGKIHTKKARQGP